MSSEKLQYLILGYGAVGIIKAYHLEKSGKVEVTALARGNADAAQHGIRIESSNPAVGTIDSFKPSRVLASAAEAADRQYDAILIATKCVPDVRPTSELLKPFIPPNASPEETPAIVLLQNGIGIEQDVQTAYPNASVMSGAIYTTTNVNAGEAYTVVNGTLNRTVLGLYQGEPDAPLNVSASQQERGSKALRTLSEVLNEGGWPTQISENILADRYKKNLWNCSWGQLAIMITQARGFADSQAGVVNAISRAPGLVASINETNRSLTLSLVKPLLDELLSLAREMGLTEALVPAAIKDQIIGVRFSMTLDPKTTFPATFKPSIQVDLENGRPFEVECIVGYLADKATSFGLVLPFLQYTYAVLKLQQNFIRKP